MVAALSLERAFAGLEGSPQRSRPLLRSVLLRALQEPELLRDLGPHSLSRELAVLSQVLLASAPPASRKVPWSELLHVERVEAAQTFVSELPSPLRAAVAASLDHAASVLSQSDESAAVDLLTLARVFALALKDPAFVQHVQHGREPEPFLAEPGAVRQRALGRR